MTKEVLIKAENVSKKFCRDLKKSLWYGVKDAARDVFLSKGRCNSNGLRHGEFWASRSIDFEVKRGECLAIIGKNGAGKTTLLKMLSGLIKPDAGNIAIKGQVGSMIALGAGFNPILTGRENVYVNATILGLKKSDIDARMDEIIEFSGINDFIDMPVRNYSSGMQVRLGFAVATALKPDVLLLDEVLAVGDAAFRARCYNKIGELLKDTAVVLVTHSMENVTRICSLGLLLSKGEVLYYGDASEAATRYDVENLGGYSTANTFIEVQMPIEDFAASIDIGARHEPHQLKLYLNLKTAILFDCHFRVQVYSDNGNMVMETESSEKTWFRCKPGKNAIQLQFTPTTLSPGRYCLSILLQDETCMRNLAWSYKELIFTITGPRSASTSIVLPVQDVTVSCH